MQSYELINFVNRVFPMSSLLNMSVMTGGAYATV